VRPADTARKLVFLRDPRSYADGSRQIEVIETHFAWVFLTRTRAYKLKKPLRQGKMDYRTLARRRQGCREEVRLNRRLSPAVYLGATPLSQDRRGRLKLGAGGKVLDWLVVMRRLPAARMLDRALADRAVSATDIDRVVAALGRFFAAARPVGATPAQFFSRLRAQSAADERELAAVSASWRALLRRVRGVQRRFLKAQRAALAARARRVVEAHGDLRPEHIHLGPPVTVIDCLEFDRQLRLRDPVEELAYLQLEARRQGRARLGQRLCQRVLDAIGDAPGPAIFAFYMSHQALTRAKLAAWHVGDPQFPEPARWLRRARSYLEDALRYGEAALRRADSAGGSLPRRGRPAVQQRRQRPAVEHAAQRLRVQRRDRQHDRAR
jgi:aminoglycoside phosphotransferase family enzyme